MVLTKLISRFARNTVTLLETVRELKELGVDVFFERENIHSISGDGELMLTILASFAQEESRSISEYVTWGQRKRFSDGKVSMPYKHFLGYARNSDGTPRLVEIEARIVRQIFAMCMDGQTPSGIAAALTKQGVPSPSGLTQWSPSTVKFILTNEKYKGDALLQKSFTVDFLSKKMKRNEGEIPSYYVKNSHPAIVTEEVFDMVQHELQRRKESVRKHRGDTCFSGKLICGECGGVYGSKVWHSTDKYRCVIWQSNRKFKNDTQCSTPHLREEAIRQAFVWVVNDMLRRKDAVFAACDEIIAILTDTTALDADRGKAKETVNELLALMRQSMRENSQTAQDQAEYDVKYEALTQRYQEAGKRLKALDEQLLERRAKRDRLLVYMNTLRKQGEIEAFDEGLWNATVETVRSILTGRWFSIGRTETRASGKDKQTMPARLHSPT